MQQLPQPQQQHHQQQLRAVGFCGIDDSVHPRHLVVLAQAFPLIEFGVLFRPDRQGQPRYASQAFMQSLVAVANNHNSHVSAGGEKKTTSRMKLAAHLCGQRVNDLFAGETDFIQQLVDWGCFSRVQINATAVNGVDTSALADSAEYLLEIIRSYPQMEFIIQKNDETQPLWQGLLDLCGEKSDNGGKLQDLLPPNLTMLVDESKGTGTTAAHWPAPPVHYDIGYAGGLGPDNVAAVLTKLTAITMGRPFWIDMESSLRSMKNGNDVFDLDKCFAVIEAVCDLQLMRRPPYLLPADVNP